MADVEATFVVMPSILTRPLLDGEVVPGGLKLEAKEGQSMDDNSRRMLNLEFDIAEMSIATYTKAREQGLPLIALPLFTSGRRFLQPGFQVRAGSEIRDLSDLKGRRVGAPQYWMSSTIWQRQILRQLYGLAAEDMSWVTFQPERLEALRIPLGVQHRLDSSGQSARDLAEAGEIDASFSPGGGPPRPQADGRPPVLEPAFPDRAAAQREYYRRTGIFPMMHITVMKEELVQSHPWIVESLCEAYQRAKDIARERTQPSAAESPAAGEITLELQELLGGDPWPYGISANRKPLEAFVETAADQKLVERRFTVEELFAPNLPDALR